MRTFAHYSASQNTPLPGRCACNHLRVPAAPGGLRAHHETLTPKSSDRPKARHWHCSDLRSRRARIPRRVSGAVDAYNKQSQPRTHAVPDLYFYTLHKRFSVSRLPTGYRCTKFFSSRACHSTSQRTTFYPGCATSRRRLRFTVACKLVDPRCLGQNIREVAHQK